MTPRSEAEVREIERYRLGIDIRPYVDTRINRTEPMDPSSTDVVPAKSNSDGAETIAASQHVEFYEPVGHCEYCGRSPCLGPDHHAYRLAHYNDPIEVERRRIDQEQRENFTKAMWREFNIQPPEY